MAGLAAEPRVAVGLSIVVPMWNEEAHIAQTLSVLTDAFQDRSAEIIVVDDGSTDRSAAVVRNWRRENPSAPVLFTALPRNGGKGAALRKGIAESTGATVAYIDADLDIPARELVRLYALLDQDGRSPANDVIIGTKRASIWHAPGVPLARRIVSATFSECVRVLFSLPVRDTQTGLKLFPGTWLRAVAAAVDLNGFLFDLELVTRAHADGCRISEIQVIYTPQREANRITMRHLVASVGELARVFWRIRVQGSRRAHSPAEGTTPAEPVRP